MRRPRTAGTPKTAYSPGVRGHCARLGSDRGCRHTGRTGTDGRRGDDLADPEAANLASRRVLEKNGFRLVDKRPLASERTGAVMAIYRLPPEH
jgi:hypothetical protein